MRDQNRIKRILSQIEKVWNMYPDLSLMQLLCNCFIEPTADHYYVEDDRLELMLDSVYSKAVSDDNKKRKNK